MSVRKSLLALAMSAVLTACATGPTNKPMPMAAREQIAASEVVIPLRQNEIYVYVPPTQGGVYNAGLVGALVGALVISAIDTSNASAAEKSVKPLRNALVDYSFDETFKTELNSQLAQIPWLKATEPRVVKEVTNDKLDSVLTASTASGVMMLTTDYHLDANGDGIAISVVPAYFANTQQLKDAMASKPATSGAKTQMANALYQNAFTFLARVPGATTNRDNNIQIWSANNGEALRTLLKTGSIKIAEMIAADLTADPAAKIDMKALPKTKGGPVQGGVLRSDDDGQFIYLSSGAQAYVHKSTLIAPVPGVQPPEFVDPNAPPVEKKKSARERAAEQKEAEKQRRAKAKAQ